VTLDVWPTTATRANSSPCVGSALGITSIGIPDCTVQFETPPNPSVDVDCVPPPTCHIHAHVPPPSVSPCQFEASIDAYNEVCVANLPPLFGTASGRLYVDGGDVGGYNWLRIGLTAILVPLAPGTSAGVAAFLPLPPIPTCAAPGPLTAEVVGAAAAP
jgi:hypothetical protein